MLARIGLGAFPGVYVECDESIFLGLHWTDFKREGTDEIVDRMLEGALSRSLRRFQDIIIITRHFFDLRS